MYIYIYIYPDKQKTNFIFLRFGILSLSKNLSFTLVYNSIKLNETLFITFILLIT